MIRVTSTKCSLLLLQSSSWNGHSFRLLALTAEAWKPNQKPLLKFPPKTDAQRKFVDSTREIRSIIYDHNVRIAELGRQGKVKEAREMFDRMLQRDVVSYASMISVYLKNKDLPKAEMLYFAMPQRNLVSDSAMVHAYATAGRIDLARRIFDHMPYRNVVSWTSLISGYFKDGRVDEACHLFRQMPEKNVVSWTTAVTGFARNGLIDEARDIFDQIPEKNVITWTAMIKIYIDNCQLDEALKLFHRMPERNLYSWNTVIQGCLNNSRTAEAVELFNSMPWRNAVSWTTMVSGLAQHGCIPLARKYFDQMPNKDVAAWNAMISAYAEVNFMDKAIALFNLMPNKNTVTWNAIMNGYAKNGLNGEVLQHFVLMLRKRFEPNQATLCSVLTSCEGILELTQGHGFLIRLGFERETSLCNALITGYSRTGDLHSACIAFKNNQVKDIVSWTAIILAYANHGFGQEALLAFGLMLRSGNKPDHITFVGILSACSHAGLVKKGQKLFESMSRAYDLRPKPEHYCCLVDCLGRAGQLNKAVKVVGEMPSEDRDGAVLSALLGASKLSENVELADLIGSLLIKLEPANSGGYILLANAFAACGRWDDFAHIRKQMKERKVQKVPGYSEIEVGGKNHVFFVGDKSHPEAKEIYVLLEEKLFPFHEGGSEILLIQ